MSDQTPTPRTDEALQCDECCINCSDFARQLERELTAKTAECERLNEETKEWFRERESWKQISNSNKEKINSLCAELAEAKPCSAQEAGSREYCNCPICTGFKAIRDELASLHAELAEWKESSNNVTHHFADEQATNRDLRTQLASLKQDKEQLAALLADALNRLITNNPRYDDPKSEWTSHVRSAIDAAMKGDKPEVPPAGATCEPPKIQ